MENAIDQRQPGVPAEVQRWCGRVGPRDCKGLYEDAGQIGALMSNRYFERGPQPRTISPFEEVLVVRRLSGAIGHAVPDRRTFRHSKSGLAEQASD